MSQISCKLSNFTLSKLTFTIRSINQTSEKQYVLNLAESTEISADEEQQIIQIKKQDEKTADFTFRSKLPTKLAFVEDYLSKEIFIQDLCNYKRINWIDRKEESEKSLNNKNLNLVAENSVKFEINYNETNENELTKDNKAVIQNKVNEEQVVSSTPVANNDNFSNIENENKSKKISEIIIVSQANNTIRNEDNIKHNNAHNNLIFQDIINEENTNRLNIMLKNKELDASETKQEKIKANSIQCESQIKLSIQTKIPASWNNFIEQVKSNISNLITGNQSQEEITLNKEKLLIEIMNDTMCEEIYLEEKIPEAESPKEVFWNINFKTTKYKNTFKENKAEEKIKIVPLVTEKNDTYNKSEPKLNKSSEKNEIYLSQISEKLDEQYALGSEIIKDLNTQYATLCLITGNKSNENFVNSNDILPLNKEFASDPDNISEQQRKIDEIIKQAISDNQKLKNEYISQIAQKDYEEFKSSDKINSENADVKNASVNSLIAKINEDFAFGKKHEQQVEKSLNIILKLNLRIVKVK